MVDLDALIERYAAGERVEDLCAGTEINSERLRREIKHVSCMEDRNLKSEHIAARRLLRPAPVNKTTAPAPQPRVKKAKPEPIPAPDLTARDQEILQMRLRGESMPNIGKHFGLSSGRVYKILVAMPQMEGKDPTQLARQARVEAQQDLDAQRREGLLIQARQFCEGRDFIMAPDLKAAIPCSTADMTWLQSQDLGTALIRPSQDTSRTVQFGTDEISIALREVSARATSSPLQRPEYDRLRNPEQPSGSTIILRLSWRGALLAAGLPAGSPRPGRADRISEQQMIDGVRRYLKQTTGVTFAGYEQWRKPNGAPSQSVLRARLGAWPKIVEMALSQER